MVAATKKFNKLAGTRVLVIGGSAGIGFGVAEGALAEGADVVISSSSQARVDAAVAALEAAYPERKGHVSGVVADLGRAREATLDADLDALFAAAGRLDHVVCTAADALTIGDLQTITPEMMRQAMHMRLVLPFMLGKAAARHLAATNRASLTLTGGTVAEKPPAKGWGCVAFLAGGVESLAKALAVDIAPRRVNVVRPAFVDTPLWDGMAAAEKAAMVSELEKKNLTAQAGQVEDVAEAYLWLMKDGNVTGSVANTDSGMLIQH